MYIPSDLVCLLPMGSDEEFLVVNRNIVGERSRIYHSFILIMAISSSSLEKCDHPNILPK